MRIWERIITSLVLLFAAFLCHAQDTRAVWHWQNTVSGGGGGGTGGTVTVVSGSSGSGTTSVQTATSMTPSSGDVLFAVAAEDFGSCATVGAMSISDGTNTYVALGSALLNQWNAGGCAQAFIVASAAASSIQPTCSFANAFGEVCFVVDVNTGGLSNSYGSCNATSSPACFSDSRALQFTSSYTGPSFSAATKSIAIMHITAFNGSAFMAGTCTNTCTIPTNGGPLQTDFVLETQKYTSSGTSQTMGFNFTGTSNGMIAWGVTVNYQ